MTRSILDIDRLIADYNLYLTLEKGASANTREGYVRDVRRFLKWLSDGKGEASTLREVTTDVLRLYLGDLNDVGIALSTRGRIVSSLRSFLHISRWTAILMRIPASSLSRHVSASTCPKCSPSRRLIP